MAEVTKKIEYAIVLPNGSQHESPKQVLNYVLTARTNVTRRATEELGAVGYQPSIVRRTVTTVTEDWEPIDEAELARLDTRPEHERRAL